MSKTPIVIFGEVLFDCFQGSEPVLGGAPFNVAWHLHAFRTSPQIITAVGDDELGEKIKSAMHHWGMSTNFVQTKKEYETGVVNIEIKDNEPHYTIRENCAYDNIDNVTLPKWEEKAFLYHGSLATRNQKSKATLANLLEQQLFNRFIDVNLRTPWWNKAEVLSSIASAYFVKLNIDELCLLSDSSKDMPWLDLAKSFKFDHDIKHLLITRGGDAASLIDDKNTVYTQPCPPDQGTLVDTVGAGDAYSSVVLLGIYERWSWPTTLERAQEFASYIVTQRGATSKDLDIYNAFRKRWS